MSQAIYRPPNKIIMCWATMATLTNHCLITTWKFYSYAVGTCRKQESSYLLKSHCQGNIFCHCKNLSFCIKLCDNVFMLYRFVHIPVVYTSLTVILQLVLEPLNDWPTSCCIRIIPTQSWIFQWTFDINVTAVLF